MPTPAPQTDTIVAVEGVFEGFATIGSVIAVGYVLAQVGVLGLETQAVLTHLAFFVASPALLVTVVSTSDVSAVFSPSLIATAAAIALTAAVYLATARLLWKKDTGELIIGALSAVYVNAANLGIPIAAYVLGDAALVAPILMLQLLVIQPCALALLGNATDDHSFGLVGAFASALRNPLTIGSLVGLALALTNTTLPDAIHQPLALIGNMAVPATLLAFGIALRLGPRPISGGSRAEIVVISVIKVVLQPLAAYAVARFVLGVDGATLYAVTVLAALPTAQNIFVHASRYNRSVVIARDAIFLTTMLSIPALLAISALLT